MEKAKMCQSCKPNQRGLNFYRRGKCQKCDYSIPSCDYTLCNQCSIKNNCCFVCGQCKNSCCSICGISDSIKNNCCVVCGKLYK